MVLETLGGLDTVHWVADVYASPRQCVTTQTPMHARTRNQDEERGAERPPRRVWIAIVGLSPEHSHRSGLKKLVDEGCTFDGARFDQEGLERYAVAVAVPGTPDQTVADMWPERRFNAEPQCSLQAFIKDLPRDLGIQLIAKLQFAAKEQVDPPTSPVAHTGGQAVPPQVALPAIPFRLPVAPVGRARRRAVDDPPGDELGAPPPPRVSPQGTSAARPRTPASGWPMPAIASLAPSGWTPEWCSPNPKHGCMRSATPSRASSWRPCWRSRCPSTA